MTGYPDEENRLKHYIKILNWERSKIQYKFQNYNASRRKHMRVSLWVGRRQRFLIKDIKVITIKEKFDTLNFINNFCSSRYMLKKWIDKPG